MNLNPFFLPEKNKSHTLGAMHSVIKVWLSAYYYGNKMNVFKGVFLATLFAVVSCGKKQDTLRFDTFSYTEITQTNCDRIPCARIHIRVPEAFGDESVSDKINDTIQNRVANFIQQDERIEKFIRNDMEANTDKKPSFKKVIKSFVKSYLNFKRDFPDSPQTWEAVINGKVTYKSARQICVFIDVSIYSGGANSFYQSQYFNFDPGTGDLIDPKTLIADIKGFTRFAETKFREAKGIPSDKNLNSYGTWFDNDRFILPKNIGLIKDSLHLFYNLYEIGPRSYGLTELKIPYKEVERYMKQK